MDPAEFDQLIARARNPRLIPGIYNYCDGRCARCAFTDRCLLYVESDDGNARAGEEADIGVVVNASLERTMEMLTEIARREGGDLSAAADGPGEAATRERAHEDDPLVSKARDYGTLAWRVARALAPVVAARAEPAAIDAVESIEWFSSYIAPKLYRAVCGRAEAWQCDDTVQTDYDGSAKAALVGIRESRAAWLTLMEAGKATADGIPAQAVRMLDELDTAVQGHFPRAAQFVRPGFDEPDVAAGAPASLPPWARRPPRREP